MVRCHIFGICTANFKTSNKDTIRWRIQASEESLTDPEFLISPSFFIGVNDYFGSTLESLFYTDNNGSHAKNPDIKTPLVAKNE